MFNPSKFFMYPSDQSDKMEEKIKKKRIPMEFKKKIW